MLIIMEMCGPGDAVSVTIVKAAASTSHVALSDDSVDTNEVRIRGTGTTYRPAGGKPARRYPRR